MSTRLPISIDVSPFLVYCYAAHRALHSFPTRRSSDLHIAFDMADLDGVMRGIGRLRDAGFDCVWGPGRDRKSTRLNSSHVSISYAVFCLKKKRRRDAPCLP